MCACLSVLIWSHVLYQFSSVTRVEAGITEQGVLRNTYFSLSLAHPSVELHQRNFASATAEGSWTGPETYMASRVKVYE